MSLTCLPRHVSQGLRGLGPCFRQRHQLIFSWLLVWPLVYGERAHLNALARHGPSPLAYQPYRRLLWAASWCTKTLPWWFADQALQAFPPPRRPYAVSGRRQSAQGHARAQASGGPQHALEPVPSRCLRLADGHCDGSGGRRSPPPGCRAASAQSRSSVSARTGPVAPDAARFPAASMVSGGGGHRRCRLRLAGPSGPYAGAGLWVRHGPAPHLEIGPWESPQRPGDPSAAQHISPDSPSDGPHATAADVLGLRHTPHACDGAIWQTSRWCSAHVGATMGRSRPTSS
jgi:hypothetical protein